MRPILFAAAMIGAASVLTTTDAMAQCSTRSIPLPSPALLTPPPEFTCEFKTASPNDATGQPQPGETRGQADPAAAAAALLAKLDYERLCYRHARTILRDGLLQLQASVGETIKAVNRACPAGPRSRKSIPLPGRALLTPPPDFDCEFKDSSLDDAGAAPQPNPTRAQADAALRMKLDYERQCYRHDEVNLRNSLRLLQVSVGETIKAVSRNGPPAARQQPAGMAQRPDDRTPVSAQDATCAAFSHGKCIGRDPDPRVRSMIRHDATD